MSIRKRSQLTATQVNLLDHGALLFQSAREHESLAREQRQEFVRVVKSLKRRGVGLTLIARELGTSRQVLEATMKAKANQ